MRVFQLPLSGSHPYWHPKRIVLAYDLSTPSLGITSLEIGYLANYSPDIGLAFNSLSRDHVTHVEPTDVSGFPTFNSLSRDHLITDISAFDQCQYYKLSTPSLGITLIPGAIIYGCWHILSTPSLGITSREYKIEKIVQQIVFQLPLSGSPSLRHRITGRQLAFNSLSRDHPSAPALRRLEPNCPPDSSFNSLSRDHQ